MSERKDRNAEDGVNRLVPALGQTERPGHHAKSQRSNGDRQHETVLESAPAKRNSAENHCQHQPDFVNDRLAKEAAGRCQDPDEDRRPNAMHQTQPGQSHRNPVEPVRRSGLERHLRRI